MFVKYLTWYHDQGQRRSETPICASYELDRDSDEHAAFHEFLDQTKLERNILLRTAYVHTYTYKVNAVEKRFAACFRECDRVAKLYLVKYF